MKSSLAQSLASIQESFNNRLDMLEIKLINISDATFPNSLLTDHNDLSKELLPTIPQEVASSREADESNEPIPMKAIKDINLPEDQFTDLIFKIRRHLAKKASAKRLIEKSNSQYVDLKFQRLSTEMYAYITQQSHEQHKEILDEIDSLDSEVEELRNVMYDEFQSLRTLIDEVAELQRQKASEEQSMMRKGAYKGRVARNHNIAVPLLKKRKIETSQSRKSDIQKKKSQNLTLAPINITNLLATNHYSMLSKKDWTLESKTQH